MLNEIVIVFENAPGPEPARFVDVENATQGGSITVEWTHFDHNPDRWALGSFVLWEDAKRLQEQIDAQERRIIELRATLEWYAEIDHYDDEHAPGTRGFLGFAFDEGRRAREALGQES